MKGMAKRIVKEIVEKLVEKTGIFAGARGTKRILSFLSYPGFP